MPAKHCFSNAVVMTNGTRNHHAWVEQGNKVIDPTAGVIVSKKFYYRDVEAIVDTKYTVEQALICMLKSKHFGPWNE
jgi:hypothetical protein